jgi:two-component system uhpT operon response regulator UhpA
MQRAQPVRVAVVDSHVLVAEGLAALLIRAGLEVVATVSSWQLLLEHPDMPVDVVVLDLHLNDGLLISTRVRELTALGTSAVVVSRRTDASSVASAMRAGARGFVATGDSPSDFVAAVRTAATGGHHLADHRADAVRTARTSTDAGLGRQEERAIVLYSAGRSLREVAAAMDTTEETVKSYVKRARRKYRDLGVDIGTRQQLRQYAHAQGWAAAD